MNGVKTFSTLKEAVNSRNGPKRIYAYNVPCTYIVAREKTFFKQVLSNYSAESRYFYEIIEEDKPCHLYIDLDVNLEKYPGMDVHTVKDMICSHVEFGLKSMSFVIEKIIVADSSNDKKGSLHIVYKIKDKLWASNAHVGAFMRCCLEKRVRNMPEDLETWKLFVDMSVYSRNRLFRMLGCTKKHENRIKRIKGQAFNYENWLDSMVQPLHVMDRDIIEACEPNGDPAKYMGSKVVSMGIEYCCDVKEDLLKFASTIAPVRGISYIPLYRMWVINLHKRDCVYKGDIHGKNTNYMVITKGDHKFPENLWHLRCWSQKYECCKNPTINKKPLPDELKKRMEMQSNFMICPSVNTC